MGSPQCQVPYKDMISDSVESMQDLMQYVCLGGRLITTDGTTPKKSAKKNNHNGNDRSSSSPQPLEASLKSSIYEDERTLQAYCSLMEACWQQMPRDRPSAEDTLLEFEKTFFQFR